MKSLFLCFVFSFLTITPSYSQNAKKDVIYFGNIGEEVMNRERAEAEVKSYFARKLKNTTRHAVIAPTKNNDIITVNIIELSGAPFYSMDIDRKSGKVINDKQYDRYVKIQADLQKKKQESMERAAVRNKYQDMAPADAGQGAGTANNDGKNLKGKDAKGSAVTEQPPSKQFPRRRRRSINAY